MQTVTSAARKTGNGTAKAVPDAIVWENPPLSGRIGSVLAEILAQVRERPHEWARVKVFGNKSSANLQHLKLKHPGFEFVTRTIATGRALYAKYTPIV